MNATNAILGIGKEPVNQVNIQNNANAVAGTDQATLRERIKNELKLIKEYSDGC